MPILLILLLAAAAYWYVQQQKKSKAMPAFLKRWKWPLTIGLGLTCLAALLGRAPLVAGLASAGFLVLHTLGGHLVKHLWHQQPATFNTPFLKAQLHLKGWRWQGEIKQGLYAGSRLEALTRDQLEELAAYYQPLHTPSYYLIEALRHPRGDSSPPPPQTPSHAPDVAQALDILGLEWPPSKADILKAHKRLIHKLHPDKGGNAYLAAQVNTARDVLLKRLEA